MNRFRLANRIRDVKYGIQIGSDWPKMGQIWDFLRSVSVNFGSSSQNVLKLVLKSLRFVPFRLNLTDFGADANIPDWDRAGLPQGRLAARAGTSGIYIVVTDALLRLLLTSQPFT